MHEIAGPPAAQRLRYLRWDGDGEAVRLTKAGVETAVICERLNYRPRKRLGFRSPQEVIDDLIR